MCLNRNQEDMVADYSIKINGDVHDILPGSGSHLEVATPQSQALISSLDEYRPKVRKEYTVKNDRQKWTDEEHLRFIEAIKLYKRKWSLIEAHVGTKSAIQIRSHAQKYFAKVERGERGSISGSEGSLNPLEIPPPRPKKKPTHPYPKKKRTDGTMHANQDEQSPSPIIEEVDTSSPTSVFSAMGSDTSGPPCPEPLRTSRLSPKSCITDVEHSVNPSLMSLLDNDNECMTSNSFDDKQKGHHLELIQVTPPATNGTVSELDLTLTLGGKFSLDNAATDESLKSTLVFGKTLTCHKPSSSATEDNGMNPKDATVEELKVGNGQQLVQNLPNVDPKPIFGFINGILSPIACPAPYYSDAGVPVYGWFHGVFYPVDPIVVPPCANIEVNELKTKASDVESKAGSRTLQQESATEKGVASSKRFVTERDETSSLDYKEEHRRRRARVCL